MVYELDGLSFIDVAGLRILDAAPDTNTPIKIRNPSRQVRRLLDLAGREEMIDNTTVDAVAAASSEPRMCRV